MMLIVMIAWTICLTLLTAQFMHRTWQVMFWWYYHGTSPLPALTVATAYLVLFILLTTSDSFLKGLMCIQR